MEKVKGMVMAMIPVALGVAAGMLIYEQVKKQTAAKAIEDAVGKTLDNGFLTGDLLPANERHNAKSTSEVGDYICQQIIGA